MKKKNEKEPLTLKEKRQIDIISKYHDVDIENRVVNLNLHYEKASDLIVTNFVRKDPVIKNEILEELASIILLFPHGFKSNLSLIIDDYEDVDPQKLLNSFKDSLEMLHYSAGKQRNRTWIGAAVFFVTSFVLLSLKFVLATVNLLNTDGILYEMMDIISWVFLWQAVTLLFLTPNEMKNVSNSVGRVLLSIGFYDKNQKLLAETNKKEMAIGWVKDSRLEKTAKTLTIIGAALVIATGITDFFNAIVQVYSIATASDFSKAGYAIVLITLTFVEAVIFILGGISGINTYRGHGPLKKGYAVFAHIFMIFTLLGIGLVIAICIILNLNMKSSAALIIGSVVSLLSAIIYFISYLLSVSYRKKEKAFIESQYTEAE